MLRTLVLEQVKKSKELTHDLAYYQRLPLDHEDKSLDFLVSCVRRAIDAKRQELSLIHTDAADE